MHTLDNAGRVWANTDDLTMKAPPVYPEPRILELKTFRDARGFFIESYNKKTLEAEAITCEFVQDNHSRSVRNVVRGLHYQIRQPQGKLVRVLYGEVLDVAVDIRRGSPSFGRHFSFLQNAEHPQAAWIPAGFAHGFAVRSEFAELFYKTTDYYAPEHERTIAWDDPDLRIDWGLTGPPVLSVKDRSGSAFRDAEVYEGDPSSTSEPAKAAARRAS